MTFPPRGLAIMVVLLTVSVAQTPVATQASAAKSMQTAEPELEIPAVLYTSLTTHDRAYPTWVSAAAAVDAEGKVNEALFHPHNVTSLTGLLTESPQEDGCLQLGAVYEDVVDPPDRSSIVKAARQSELVVLATLVDRDYGFRFTEAGQLLVIRVEEVLRGRAHGDEYFVFFPVGRFEAGPYTICKTDSRYPAPPDVGGQLVVLIPEVDDPDEPYLDLVWDTSVVVIEASGRVRLPRSYTQRRPVDSMCELLDRIRSAGEVR